MFSDRRPIMLTNARIIDPSRDLDLAGDLLIADGVVHIIGVCFGLVAATVLIVLAAVYASALDIVVSAGAYFAALSKRLNSACSNNTASSSSIGRSAPSASETL